MKSILIILFLSILVSACVQTENSSTGDADTFAPVTIDKSTAAGERLSNAFGVIQRNCVSCHSQFNLTTDAQWLNTNYVVRNSPSTSSIYCRIKGSGCGAEDMPPTGSISALELSYISTWISGL